MYYNYIDLDTLHACREVLSVTEHNCSLQLQSISNNHNVTNNYRILRIYIIIIMHAIIYTAHDWCEPCDKVYIYNNGT